MKIRESAENYLEAILALSFDRNRVRSIDVANELGFTRPSVSVAMKHLRISGYITVEKGCIKLTKKGCKIAETMHERHVTITKWLVSLGVDKKTAAADACKMEHSMSRDSFQAVKKHIENFK